MFEKVNPMHPDKIADRIAGAMLDLAYKKQANPKCAVEVLIGHGYCHIINETSCHFTKEEINNLVYRVSQSKVKVDYLEVKQDGLLANNQSKEIRCGDNGIFKGVPITMEQEKLATISKKIYGVFPFDGKYIINNSRLVICQSNDKNEILKVLYPSEQVNPLGYWTGGISVDSGATNRKLGSDMGDSITGGGLHGKDFSKADVSVNIYAFLKAQEVRQTVKCYCAIGDEKVKVKIGNQKQKLVFYKDIVEIAKDYVNKLGGFEKFAEWGLVQ